jgi:hypothetical protein
LGIAGAHGQPRSPRLPLQKQNPHVIVFW